MESPSGIGPHVIDRLVDYYSGSLTDDQELAIEAHLLHCARCRAEYDELGTVALQVAALPADVLVDSDEPPGPG